MSIVPRALVWFITGILCAPAFAADPPTRPVRPSTGDPDARFAALDQAVISFADLVDAGAVTVAVNVDGKLVYSRGFGWSDKERKQPVAPDAIMRVASVSKPFTVAMTRKLIADKKLSYDTRAFEYLGLKPIEGAQADPRLATITVKHLLQHTGGWDRDAAFDPMFRMKDVEKTLKLTQPPTATDVIRYMLGKPLQFDPGSKSAYSNFGYCVLGRIIEKATGDTYEKTLHAMIAEPLKIEDLKIGRTHSKQRDPKEVYYPVRDELFSLDVMDAHGGIVASAPALCRVMQSYWIGGTARERGAKGQQFLFFGSLPGTTAMVMQRRDGIDVAVLLNNRRNNSIDADVETLRKSVDEALAGVKL